MIHNFRSDAARDIFAGQDTKKARKAVDPKAWPAAQRKMLMLRDAGSLNELRSPGTQLEKLEGTMPGFWGMRINNKYRLVFRWEGGNAHDVDVTDYH
ncbi:MAG TPA: type II toxin-antitoxin system RelE/ParE family toxin [Gemmatimonadales bacterium]|nr:type II toxin-antitoxin system RelE/ParE family toxin [Gemmatimonadales bacterium]